MDEAELDEILRKTVAPVDSRLKEIFGKPKEPKEVYGLLSEFFSFEGKRLRPALCLLSCEVVGGKKEDALAAATAIEMFHNFTLIHDDIEDDSKMRRGSPCLHVKYGIPLALNAGDGLFMMVWREARRIKGPKKEKAQELLLSAFTEVLEGQAIELGWYKANNWDVDEAAYRRVISGKTGALIAVSCEVGGLLGGGSERQCRALSLFGRKIGMGFQIVDDVLNIVGEEALYGKEIGGDIREGKRTLIVIEALKALPPNDRQLLLNILKKEKKGDEEVDMALSLIKKSGAPKRALQAAEREIKEALSLLRALPSNPKRKALEMLAVFVLKRRK
ncbi:MAG: polyprenyl synthetase family protein [Candidatus Micrarchaeota archaeon]|nr:polyprenyl synthetase family protein [Candidatus Micrarchaeota archaeon]